MFRHRFENFFVDERLVTERAQILRDVEQRRIRRTVGQRRQRGVDDLDAELDRFETAERTETGGAVGVQLDGNAVGVGEHDRHQRLHAFRREQAAGIFEAEPIDFERRGLAGALGEIFIGVFRRDRIDDVRHRIDADVARDFASSTPSLRARSTLRRCALRGCRWRPSVP